MSHSKTEFWQPVNLYMDKSPKKFLEDILTAINHVEGFVNNHPKRFDYFCEDTCYSSAVKYQIAVIGEAVSQLKKLEPSITITNARKIIDTRNYIIHAYDSLRLDILWSIVMNHLCLLKREVETLLLQYP